MAPNDQLNAQREQMITEKLVLGWTLLPEVSCPVCTTPLMANQTVADSAPPDVKVAVPTAVSEKIIEYQEILAQDSFIVKNSKKADGKELIAPSSVYAANNEVAPNVPYCILCKSHVVMDASDMGVLASMDLLSERNQRGSVIIYPQENNKKKDDVAIATAVGDGGQATATIVSDSIGVSASNSIVAGTVQESVVAPGGSVTTNNVLPSGVGGMAACANMGVPPLSTAIQLNGNGDQPSVVQSQPSVVQSVNTAANNTEVQQQPLPDIGTMPSNMGIEAGIGNAQSTVAPGVSMSKDEGENGGVTEEVIDEYNVRRDIATKVLGAKMIQGYTLKETQCDKCGMPMMEYKGQLECVVCPVLIKKAKKKKAEEEAARLAQAREQAESAERVIASELKVLEDEMKRRKEALQQEEITRAEMKATEEATVAAKELLVLAELRAIKAARQEEEARRAYAEDAYQLVQRRRQETEADMISSAEEKAKEAAKRAEQATESAKAAQLELEKAKERAMQFSIGQLEAETMAELNNDIEEDQAHWNFLRSEASKQMSRRMLQGWTMTSLFCRGKECGSAPLLQHGSTVYCVVCGGTGSGQDGAYGRTADLKNNQNMVDQAVNPIDAQIRERREIATREIGKRMMVGWTLLGERCNGCEIPTMERDGVVECVMCGPMDVVREQQKQVEEEEEPVESEEEKRDRATREIGKRVMEGWRILDKKCDLCEVPMLTLGKDDEKGECVLCGAGQKKVLTEEERDRAVSEIGRRMLDGWKLEDDVCCEVCDLRMCSKGDVTECVVCGPVLPPVNVNLELPPNFDFSDPKALEALLLQVQKKTVTAHQVAPPAPVVPQKKEVKVEKQAAIEKQAAVEKQVISAPSTPNRYASNRTNNYPNTPSSMQMQYSNTPSYPNTPSAVPVTTEEISMIGAEQKIREGWTMLSRAYCDCGGPMMRPPNSREAMCVNIHCVNSCFQSDATEIERFRSQEQDFVLQSTYRQNGGNNVVNRPLPPRNSQGKTSMPQRGRNVPRPYENSPARSMPPVSYVQNNYSNDDASNLSDYSLAKTVASDALGAILGRIEAAKAELMSPSSDINQAKDTADLIEKLASAAVAVKNLEENFDHEP